MNFSNNRLAGKTILLVEDMELNRFLLQEMVRDWPVQLDMAVTGEEGLAKTVARKYDVILMDIRLPRLSGTEVTIALRSDPANPNHHTPVIAMTANAFDTDEAAYLEAGMDTVLAKPFDSVKLYNTLAGVLEEKPAGNNETETVTAATVSIDLSYLLEVGKQNRSFVGMMLHSFHESADEVLLDLDKAVRGADWSRSAELVHKMKFALNVVGAGKLDSELGRLENAARLKGQGGDAELEEEFKLFMHTIRNLYNQAGVLLQSGEWK